MKRRLVTPLGLTVACLTIAVTTAWGALVLFYLAPGSATMRTAFAWVFVVLGLVTLGSLAVRWARGPAAGGFTVVFVLVLVVWTSATPSDDCDGVTEVAVLPYATLVALGWATRVALDESGARVAKSRRADNEATMCACGSHTVGRGRRAGCCGVTSGRGTPWTTRAARSSPRSSSTNRAASSSARSRA